MNTYNQKLPTQKLLVLLFLFAVCFTTVSAFVPPTQIPSGGNAEPIWNISTADQIKVGPFGLGNATSSGFFSEYGTNNMFRVGGISSIEGNTAIQLPNGTAGVLSNWTRNLAHTLTTNGAVTASTIQNSTLQTAPTATVIFSQLANLSAGAGSQTPVCVQKGSASNVSADGTLVPCVDSSDNIGLAPPTVDLTAQYPQGINIPLPVTAQLSWTSQRATGCFQLSGPAFAVPGGLSGRAGSNVTSALFSESVKFTIGCVNASGQLATDSVDVLLGYPAPTVNVSASQGNFNTHQGGGGGSPFDLYFDLTATASKPSGAANLQCHRMWSAEIGTPRGAAGGPYPWSGISSGVWTNWTTVTSPHSYSALEVICTDLFVIGDCYQGGVTPSASINIECRTYDGGSTYSDVVGDSTTIAFQ